MRKDATPLERFEGWFARPIAKLHELPEGDGAYVALSVALSLCERYYRTITNTQEDSSDGRSFKEEAARDLGIDPNMFSIFWAVYRNGIQHQGMPRAVFDKKSGRTYYAEINEPFYSRPSFVPYDASTWAVRISPSKFADLILDKFRQNPAVLEKAVIHSLAEVYDTSI